MTPSIKYGNIIYRPVPPGDARTLTLPDGRPRSDFINYQETLEYRHKNGIPQPYILTSACLAGEPCRYDGKSNLIPCLKTLVDKGDALPVCPECAGGLPCPRPPCERRNGKIFTQTGCDYTAPFHLGAEKCLEAARVFPIEKAILKERSPSCGVHEIYDGTFSRHRIPGMGIFAEALSRKGIVLSTEQDFPTKPIENSHHGSE